jgi:hypothetical protein
MIALMAALGLFLGIAGTSVSAQAADAAVGDTPVTFGDPWRASILPPVIAADHAVLKAGSQAIVISAPEDGAAFADQVVTSIATFAPHVSADVLTVSMDGEALQTGTFQNSGETYAYLALAPTADVPFVQVAIAPEAELPAAVTSAQASVKVGDAALFAGVTIDDRAITVQTVVGEPSASPEASPAA